MEYDDYKRAKQIQEETLPAFERLKEAVSVGTLDNKAIKEIGDSFANAMFYENDFADSLVVFIDGLSIKFKEEFNKLQVNCLRV